MRIFVIAGEPSGDRLGAALMGGLKALAPGVEFRGVGGSGMEGEGLESLFPMEELSVMGIAEVLPKYRHLMRRIKECAAEVVAWQPDALVTIDSPDFCLRVARRVKAEATVKTIHYVAPTVWAWRAGRAEKMAQVIDHVLALFPFEPPYMEAAGMSCDFVGHPVVSEPVANEADGLAFRAAHGIGDAPLVMALPGSRRGEVGRLAPIFGEALRPVVAARPETRVVVPCVASTAGLVQELTARWPGAPVLVDPRGKPAKEAQAEKRAAFAAADVALAASGTVSLELAAAALPMVIAYDMNWLSRQIISRMLKIDTVTLVNLVAESRTIPEFIGAECKPAKIAEGLKAVMAAPGAQLEAMAVTMDRLGRGDEPPGLRAARSVLAQIG
ncbi:lipid-A-disaccharide synthase [Vannielia litorea]|uniref:lipid-A-disaccharide synthase n=1 Tax=Vannielia litorea TaxID=1217970 RepID=UPI001C94282E|nr:lipid-A-disaccharide synthase [Vannielia litorea]MBY6047381.1 lipid-A-disaccharide synthase [Vannielia litorea]MBY6074795.1 lipid-A-disaccharide synthase [Vannielia litorea]